eukprot:1139338-Pelagomonas_calceolata.AAC.1
MQAQVKVVKPAGIPSLRTNALKKMPLQMSSLEQRTHPETDVSPPSSSGLTILTNHHDNQPMAPITYQLTFPFASFTFPTLLLLHAGQSSLHTTGTFAAGQDICAFKPKQLLSQPTMYSLQVCQRSVFAPNQAWPSCYSGQAKIGLSRLGLSSKSP